MTPHIAAPLRFPHPEAPAVGGIVEVAPGVLWLRLALPFALDHVNVYLIEDRGGWAVLEASELVKAQLLARASTRLHDERGVDASPDQLHVRDGWVFVKSAEGVRMSVRDVLAGLENPLTGASDRRRVLTVESVATGAHAVEVEVHTKTGTIRIIRYVAVHDVGRVLNRMALEQQVEGGIAMGIGGALYEELLVDQETGLPLNANILDYKPPSFLELPPFEIDFVEFPQDFGPFGAVAIGQASTPPVGPVIANAFYNAVGVWVTDLPLSRRRVLAALGARA